MVCGYWYCVVMNGFLVYELGVVFFWYWGGVCGGVGVVCGGG